MATFERHYLRLQDMLQRQSVPVLTLAALLFVVATIGVTQLRLDLSFRPLFASGAEAAAPTEEFEAVFGQSSGAWIIAVLENRHADRGEFVRTAARMSDAAMAIDGISDNSQSLEHPRTAVGRRRTDVCLRRFPNTCSTLRKLKSSNTSSTSCSNGTSLRPLARVGRRQEAADCRPHRAGRWMTSPDGARSSTHPHSERSMTNCHAICSFITAAYRSSSSPTSRP